MRIFERFLFGRVVARTVQSGRLCKKETTMTSLKMWTGVCGALLLVATLLSGTAVAQDPKAQTPKVQDAKTVDGMLMGIDSNAKILTLKAGDDEIQFSYTDQTELVAPEGDSKPAVVKQGTKVRVHYTEQEKAKVATKVEIIEATAAQ
jgi:hypothetical protein